MFTRPGDLTDDEVGAALATGWNLDVTSVEHAPLGFGSHHWFVTTADGCRWFATVDDLRTRRVGPDEPLVAPFDRLRAALTTARALREHGLGHPHGGVLACSAEPAREEQCSTDGLTTLRTGSSVVLNQPVEQKVGSQPLMRRPP